MKFFDYTKLSFSALVLKIGKSRYFDLPAMLEEVLNRLSGRVETLENAPAPSGGIATLSGDFVDNTDPTNPTLDRGYKVYTALLTQLGTDAPVATVLENTLGDNITFSYLSTGSFEVLNSDNNFPYNKLQLILNSNQPGTILLGGSEEDPDGNTLKLNKYEVSAGNLEAQNTLANATIEIRVYN